jgi:hypothetical protein
MKNGKDPWKAGLKIVIGPLPAPSAGAIHAEPGR